MNGLETLVFPLESAENRAASHFTRSCPRMARNDGESGDKGGNLVVLPGRQRPEPPPEMLPEQAQIWRETVNAMRPDWFATPTPRALLRDFCTIEVVARRLARELRSASPMTAQYLSLAKTHREAVKSLLQLATALRLTPASNRKNVRDGRTGPGDFRPWDVPS
jgi:phage terminase small subunit